MRFLLLDPCMNCGARLDECPMQSAHRHPWARSSWPFPALTYPKPPSLGVPELQACCVTPRSGVVLQPWLAVGTDTILLLSKHPWQAVIRLFWLLIRAAVPWITHPGWPCGPWGCSLLAAGLRRWCPRGWVLCPVPCSRVRGVQGWPPGSACSGLCPRAALLGTEGLLVGTGTALLSLSGGLQRTDSPSLLFLLFFAAGEGRGRSLSSCCPLEH